MHIFSPATVANVGPGFDILGFGVHKPQFSDIVEKGFNDRKAAVFWQVFSADKENIRTHGFYAVGLIWIEICRDIRVFKPEFATV